MKIVAFSDSHGNRELLREAAEQALRGAPIDICVHCGDGVRDLDALEPILRDRNPNVRLYAVRGNCDVGAFDMPILEMFEAEGVRMMATHGHAYHVKTEYGTLLSVAQARGAKVAFFGHTHHPLLEPAQGIYLINPGAVCQHLPGNIAYAQVLVSPGGAMRTDLMPWLR